MAESPGADRVARTGSQNRIAFLGQRRGCYFQVGSHDSATPWHFGEVVDYTAARFRMSALTKTGRLAGFDGLGGTGLYACFGTAGALGIGDHFPFLDAVLTHGLRMR